MRASPAKRLEEIFLAYDVRGVVPEQLDGRVAYAVGAGFADFVRRTARAERIVVGRDMRSSGVELASHLEAGILAEGLKVTDAGMISTDMCYFAAGSLDLPGVMLTASHNPARYNGIKMCLPGARPVGTETGLSEVKKRAIEVLEALGDDPAPDLAEGAVEHVELLEEFTRHVHSFVDVSKLAPLRLVADTANAMGGLVAPAVLGSLPFDLELLFAELDGTFPNHPADPIQRENLRFLVDKVRSESADVGLAFDGDADRVFLVDETGEPVSGSLMTAIVAAALLDKSPGETVLYNLICSKAVPEVIAEHGGKAVRTRVGHSFIKGVMEETGAIFGGEHSGHYYFRENYRADSGIIASLVVLSVISEAEKPLSELRRPFERYADSGEINTEVRDPAAVLEGVETAYEEMGAEIDKLDGLTADMGEWWFNLRPSNTEPLLRLNLEAADEESCRAHVDEVRTLMTRLEEEGETADGS